MTENQLATPAENEPLIPAASISSGGVGKIDSTGLVDVAQNSLLKGSTLTGLKVPRVALRSDTRIVPRRRELELDWSGVAQEADDVAGGRCGVGGDLPSHG